MKEHHKFEGSMSVKFVNYCGTPLKYKNEAGEYEVIDPVGKALVNGEDAPVGRIGNISVSEVKFKVEDLPAPVANVLVLVPMGAVACIVASGARTDVAGVKIPRSRKSGKDGEEQPGPLTLKEIYAGNWIKKRSFLTRGA